MREYDLIDLFNMTRSELFDLHSRIVADMQMLAEEVPEQEIAKRNLRRIRRVLARYSHR